MTDFELSHIASIEPAELAKLVMSTSDTKIVEVMSGEQRSAILDEVFSRFPKLFHPDRAGSISAVIHWVITGGAGDGPDTYQVVIENGACTTSSAADRDPRLTITVGPVEFLKVVSGAGNPLMMFMNGTLKAKGDLGLAANIANFFAIPKD